jgi:hypothetical protein
MMANDRYIFARLGSINYANDWNVRMEAVLIQKQLWGMIQILVDQTKSNGMAKTETEIETKRRALAATRDLVKLAEAHAELVLCIEPSQLIHMYTMLLVSPPVSLFIAISSWIVLSACARKSRRGRALIPLLLQNTTPMDMTESGKHPVKFLGVCLGAIACGGVLE